MPPNVFRRIHAKYNALAQTSFESTSLAHKIYEKSFFSDRAASVGHRRLGRAVGEHFDVGMWMRM